MDDLDNTVTHGHLRAAGWDTNQCCDHTKHVNYSQLKQRASKSATSSRTLFFFDASLGAAD
jgi:hypothetical protein